MVMQRIASTGSSALGSGQQSEPSEVWDEKCPPPPPTPPPSLPLDNTQIVGPGEDKGAVFAVTFASGRHSRGSDDHLEN